MHPRQTPPTQVWSTTAEGKVLSVQRDKSDRVGVLLRVKLIGKVSSMWSCTLTLYDAAGHVWTDDAEAYVGPMFNSGNNRAVTSVLRPGWVRTEYHVLQGLRWTPSNPPVRGTPICQPDLPFRPAANLLVRP